VVARARTEGLARVHQDSGPLDGTPPAAVAIRPAGAILGSNSAELVLVRVVADVPSLPIDSSEDAHTSQTYLDRIGAALRGGLTIVEMRVVFGSPVPKS
jgi:hypothetical protein